VEVIAWLAAQPWCNGAVGMMGISWGGSTDFRLRRAVRRHSKAIVTICSTDDRYTDDAHYTGGTFLTKAGLEWAFFFFSLMCLPPDPALVGDSWRAMWLERLVNNTAVPGKLVSASATRCVLEARIGYARTTPAIQCRSMPSVVGPMVIRMQSRVFSRTKGPSQGPHRSVGARLSALCISRTPDRIPPGNPAMVGSLAQGHRYRRDG